jgi:putative DNA primase/helicase
LVAEGIETVLSGMQACKLAGWAALSATGLSKLILPNKVTKVIVLADADPTGEAAAKACASRWIYDGRQVLIARPSSGKDFMIFSAHQSRWPRYEGRTLARS